MKKNNCMLFPNNKCKRNSVMLYYFMWPMERKKTNEQKNMSCCMHLQSWFLLYVSSLTLVSLFPILFQSGKVTDIVFCAIPSLIHLMHCSCWGWVKLNFNFFCMWQKKLFACDKKKANYMTPSSIFFETCKEPANKSW